jgi:hypothetical protein
MHVVVVNVGPSVADREYPLIVLASGPYVAQAFWMQTSGTALLAVERCSLVRVWMAAQDSRSAHGLLYFAAVREDRHHLIRRLCHAYPLPAYTSAGLPECYSLMRTRWRR